MLEQLVGNLPTVGMAAILAGLLRSVAGWLENALKDGVVEGYELRKLAGTIVKYFAAILLLLLGLEPYVGVEGAVATAFGLDVVTSALKNGSKVEIHS